MIKDKIIFSFSLLIYLWILSDLGTSRHIRSTNSSKFIHRDFEDEPTSSELPDICMSQAEENNNTIVSTKKRRSESINSFLQPNTSFINITELVESFSSHINISRFSREFEQCAHVFIEPECYIMLSNGSVEVPVYGRILNDTDYFITEVGELVICPEFFDDYTDESKFSATLDTFSVIGTALSTIFVILHVLMFILLKKLRNLPGYCQFSLSLALLSAYTCYFITYIIRDRKNCTAIGMIMFYSFLASFFWMNVMSYDVWRSLRLATAKLRLTRDRPMFARYARYSAYAWGGPLVIVIITLIVNSANSHYKYNLIFNINTCWFQYKQALIVYFATPFFILMALNILLFVSSSLMINSATMNNVENKVFLWSRFLISVRLAIVMGFTWICGIIATATQATALWYIYTFLNTMQGVLIFFTFSFSKKTMKECKKAVSKKKSSLFPMQTSTSQGPSSTAQQESTF